MGLSLVLFLGLSWHVYSTYTAGAGLKAAYLRGERLHDLFDNVQNRLVVSATLAVTTDDRRWDTDYARLKAQLDEELKGVMSDPWPGCDTGVLAQIAEVNTRLRAQEARALDLARHGNARAAVSLLSSSDYHVLDARFNELATRFITSHQSYLDERMRVVGVREAWSLVAALVVFGVVLATWLYLVRRLESSRRALRAEMEVRREAEQGLAATAARYRALFEQGFDGIFLVEPQTGAILGANRNAARMLGYSHDALLALNMRDVEPPGGEGESAAQPEYPAACRLREHRYRRSDGRFVPVETARCLVQVDGQSLLQVRMRDLTERERLRGELAQAQKTEAIAQLAAGIAHDFNNLLAVINGYAFLLRQRVRNDGGVPMELEKLEEATAQAGELTRSLLTFACHTQREDRPVNLLDVVRGTTAMFGATLSGQVRVHVQAPDGALWVLGDHTQLTQALLNLAINARDAMPGGGDLTFGLRRVLPGDAEFQDLGIAAAGGIACLSVEDNGHGMDLLVQGRAFDPFFTTKPRGQGTGLGLSVVRGIVNSHGGEVVLRSAPDSGTKVSIYLPESAGAEADASTSSGEEALDAVTPGRFTIVLAEGRQYVREVLAASLASAGFRVLQAGDGDDLVSILDREGGAIDCLLCDDDPSGAGGLACVRAVRARGYAQPAVVMTDRMDPGAEDEIEGDTLVVHKPFATRDLVRLLARCVSGESPT